jgi:DNA-binding transcriptional LysR family regulator
LNGRGIVNKPRFDIANHLASGALVPILEETPPQPSSFACLYPHRKLLDPKIRLFVDYMADESKKQVMSVMS